MDRPYQYYQKNSIYRLPQTPKIKIIVNNPYKDTTIINSLKLINKFNINRPLFTR